MSDYANLKKKYSKLIQDIIDLANEESSQTESACLRYGEPVPIGQLDDAIEKRSPLKDKLDSLDQETLEDLVAIMYVGRDGLENTSPQDAYDIQREHDKVPFGTKWQLVNVMMEKSPRLGEYLENAKRLLNI